MHDTAAIQTLIPRMEPEKKRARQDSRDLLPTILMELNGGKPLDLSTLAAIQAPAGAPGTKVSSTDADDPRIEEYKATILNLFAEHVGKSPEIVVGNAIRVATEVLDREVAIFNSIQAGTYTRVLPAGRYRSLEDERKGHHPENSFLMGPEADTKIWLAMFLGEDRVEEAWDVAHAENYCDATTVLQNRLLSQRAHPEAMEEEKVWLHSLEFDVCPRIQIQVDKSMTKNSGSVSRLADEEMRKLDPAPAKYRRTLFLLSEILQSKKWPQTSAARSTVIKDLYLEHDTDIEGSQLGGRLIGGSFTVVNPKAVPVNYDLPLANSLFHDLVDAVFELEESLALSELPRADESGGKSIDAAGSRTASTHCAINANAAFTPHVDSGKGLGQSLSMIVGLGDYIGGDLMIEGHGYDIRYEPLQFDGWRLRHWTDQYQGQRFSLVWFSPATGTTEQSFD